MKFLILAVLFVSLAQTVRAADEVPISFSTPVSYTDLEAKAYLLTLEFNAQKPKSACHVLGQLEGELHERLIAGNLSITHKRNIQGALFYSQKLAPFCMDRANEEGTLMSLEEATRKANGIRMMLGNE